MGNNVESYGWFSAEAPQSCNYIENEVLNILNSLSIHKVLDLGCGNGRLCGVLNRNNYDVVGIEYDNEGYHIACSQYPEVKFYNKGVQDSTVDIVNECGLVDAVISTEVIEHLFSPHLLPIFSSSCLKDNGFLIVTTPYHGYLKNLALSIFNKWDHHHTALWHGGHIKFWSKKTLTALLEGNGFKLISFSGVGRLPYLWKSMVLVAQKIQ